MTTNPLALGVDLYAFRARVMPAVLAAAPALALGIAALPLLPDEQKLWSLVAVGVTTYAALVARTAGNRVQPALVASWGGLPTTRRLRFRDNPSAQEIRHRHEEVERVLGGGFKLPGQVQELADPAGADSEYAAAMSRILGVLRRQGNPRLVDVENRNYGFARNLLGLKRLGLWCSAAVFAISGVTGLIVGLSASWADARPLILPLLVAAIAPLLWAQVDSDFVKPSADAYADRVVEALGGMPNGAP